MSDAKSSQTALEASEAERISKINIGIYNNVLRNSWETRYGRGASEIPNNLIAYCRENKQAYVMISDKASIYFMMTSGARSKNELGFYKFAVTKTKCSRTYKIDVTYENVNYNFNVYIINKENDIYFISNRETKKDDGPTDTHVASIVKSENKNNQTNRDEPFTDTLSRFFKNIYIPAPASTPSPSVKPKLTIPTLA